MGAHCGNAKNVTPDKHINRNTQPVNHGYEISPSADMNHNQMEKIYSKKTSQISKKHRNRNKSTIGKNIKIKMQLEDELLYDIAKEISENDLVEAVKLEDDYLYEDEDDTIAQILNAGKLQSAVKGESPSKSPKADEHNTASEESEQKEVSDSKVRVNQRKYSQLVMEDKKGWLDKHEKGVSKVLGPYSKRWVIAKPDFLLWNNKKKEIEDINNKQERDTFNRCFPFTVIEGCEPIETKSNNKFEIIIGRDPRNRKGNRFTLRAKNKKARDEWVDAIKQRIQRMRHYVYYLEG